MIYRLSPLLLAALLAVSAFVAEEAAAGSRRPDHAASAATGHLDLDRPPAPVGRYRPDFVHQGQNNCAFASAAMLIDKWTHGRRRPSQERLRTASRVPQTEGVGISQLARAVERGAGIDVRWSPGGGDPLTWDGLMQRLGRGGAAVVAGSYSRLPRHYTRWAPEYAALGASNSGHALYVERYEPGRRGGRVWIMDPLATGSSYRGEWISAGALRHFVWRSNNGLVHALPTPEPPPLAGYEFGDPSLIDGAALAGAEVSIALPLEVGSGWTMPRNLALSVVWTPVELEPHPDDVADAYAAEVAAARAALDETTEAAPTPEAVAPSRADPRLGDESEQGQAPDPEGAENLAVWRAERGAGNEPGQEAAETDSGADPETDAEDSGEDDSAADEPDMSPTRPTLVQLSARRGRLVGVTRAPEAAGTYRISVQLRHRDGSRFTEPAAPALADLTVELTGPIAADYRATVEDNALVPGTAATVSATVSNLGSLDWVGEDAVELAASWRVGDQMWSAGGVMVEVRSLHEEKVRFSVIVPTNAAHGELVVELLTGDGVPFELFGADAVVVPLEFLPAAAGTTEVSAPQE